MLSVIPPSQFGGLGVCYPTSSRASISGSVVPLSNCYQYHELYQQASNRWQQQYSKSFEWPTRQIATSNASALMSVTPQSCMMTTRSSHNWTIPARQGAHPRALRRGVPGKDYTKKLTVDCSIEYELPNAPKIPKNSQPILMIDSRSQQSRSSATRTASKCAVAPCVKSCTCVGRIKSSMSSSKIIPSGSKRSYKVALGTSEDKNKAINIETSSSCFPLNNTKGMVNMTTCASCVNMGGMSSCFATQTYRRPCCMPPTQALNTATMNVKRSRVCNPILPPTPGGYSSQVSCMPQTRQTLSYPLHTNFNWNGSCYSLPFPAQVTPPHSNPTVIPAATGYWNAAPCFYDPATTKQQLIAMQQNAAALNAAAQMTSRRRRTVAPPPVCLGCLNGECFQIGTNTSAGLMRSL